jgi:hypothetical protein
MSGAMVIVAALAAFWALFLVSLARRDAESAPPGKKIARAAGAVALFVGLLAICFFLQWIVHLIDPSPPCFEDEQCADLYELNRAR